MADFELNGRRYRELPDGNVQDIGPAAGGGRIIPKSATAQRKEGADASSAEADAALKSAQGQYAAQLAAAQAREAQAAANLKNAQAGQAIVETAAAPTPAPPEVKAARNELKTDSVIEAIDTARGQITKGWSTGNFTGTPTFGALPFVGQNSSNLAATLRGLTGSIINDTIGELKALSPSGASGYGSLTEQEARRLAAAVGALDQTQDEEALRNNLARVERHYRNLLALKNNEDPRDPEVAKRYGIVLPDQKPRGIVGMEGPGEMGRPDSGGAGGVPPVSPQAPDQTELRSDGQYADDPALAGVNATVSRMYQERRSAPEIRAYLNRVRPGLGDGDLGIEAAVAYARQNPNAALPVDLERVWQPATGFQETMGDIGMSPIGTGIIGAGDMFSFGALDNLSGNPDMTRAVMEGLEQRNPGSYLAGQVLAGVGSGVGIEAGLGKLGLGALGRARGGDVLLGAGYGAGSADEGSRLQGAGEGGLFGLAGGMVGRGATRGVGRAIAGVTDPARRYLADRGVPQTVGQLLGGVSQRTEDRLAGLPFIGDRIMGMRREGVEGFNRAAFEEALAPIKATTGDVLREAGIDQAQSAVSDAYRNALGPARLTLDDDFLGDLAGADAAIRRLPRVGGEVADSVEQVLDPSFLGANDSLSGENMQAMLRYLQQVRGGYSQDPLSNRIGQGVGQVEDALTSMVDRQAPEVMPAFTAANEAFRNEEVLRDAVGRARNGGPSKDPGLFMPSQLMDAASQNANRFGNSRGTTRQPFFDLSRAGQQVLPSQVPDSGSVGRAVLPTVAMSLAGYTNAGEGEGIEGGASGAATGAILTALLAGPYASRTGRDVIARSLMAERNPAIQKIGQELIERDRIAGLLATSPVLALTQGQ